MNNREMEEMIINFRDQYDEVYLTTFGDLDFVWRAITRKEHSEIAEFATGEYDAFERVCQVAVLYPEMQFSSTGLAYIPEELAPQILDESGFGGFRKEQHLLAIFRDQVNNRFDTQAEILVNRAFPYITFETMEDWTKEKLLKFVAKAEWSLHNIDDKDHLMLLTEEDIRKQKEESGDEEEQEPKEEFDIMKVAQELRKQGQDPMFVLRHLYQKERPPYFERPLIGGGDQVDTMIAGHNAWKEGAFYEGRYELIREQVQKVSRR